MHFQRTSRVLLVVTLLVAPLWGAPAAAETFTATWNYHVSDSEVPEPSPFYECGFVGGGGLICEWLWDEGLEVRKASPGLPPMYGDGGPWFDAFGFDLPLESDIFGGDLLRIAPKCLAGIQPCFDTFTPLSMDAYHGSFPTNFGGVFFTSSKGGLVTTSDGLGNFAGPLWTDIAWMDIGLFLPDACSDPESGLPCGSGEQYLSINSLTFDATPIPEPASVALLGTGLLAFARRYRRRALNY